MFASLSPLLWIHFVGALVAIASGAAIFAMPKGTPGHRAAGLAYLGAMIVVLISVAFVPATVMPLLGTRFGFFHLLMLFGGISLGFGLRALWRWHRHRESGALRQHQVRLAYSYAGLLMAGFSQFATNPRFGLVSLGSMAQFWTVFGIVNALILGGAVVLIEARLAKGDPQRWKAR